MPDIIINVGDQLLYNISNADYCLTVEDVQPEFCYVRHAAPYDYVRFKFYYYRPANARDATSYNLISSIKAGHFEHVKALRDPSWEV